MEVEGLFSVDPVLSLLTIPFFGNETETFAGSDVTGFY